MRGKKTGTELRGNDLDVILRNHRWMENMYRGINLKPPLRKKSRDFSLRGFIVFKIGRFFFGGVLFFLKNHHKSVQNFSPAALKNIEKYCFTL